MNVEDRQQQRDIQHLNAALDRTHFSPWDLWLKYYSLGGQAHEPEVEAHLDGRTPLPEFQRTLLRMAMDELNDEQAASPLQASPFHARSNAPRPALLRRSPRDLETPKTYVIEPLERLGSAGA